MTNPLARRPRKMRDIYVDDDVYCRIQSRAMLLNMRFKSVNDVLRVILELDPKPDDKLFD